MNTTATANVETNAVETVAVAPAAPVLKSSSPARGAIIAGLTGFALHALGNASVNNFTKGAAIQVGAGTIGGAIAGYFGDKFISAKTGEQITGGTQALVALNMGLLGSSVAVLATQAGVNTVNKIIESMDTAEEGTVAARISGYFSNEDQSVETEAEVVAA